MIHQLTEELRAIDQQIKDLRAELKRSPAGSICLARNGKTYKWYYKNDSSGYVYLSKKEKNLAEKLSYKKYAELELDYLLKKKAALEDCLRLYSQKSESESLLQQQSPYRDLILPLFADNPHSTEKLSAWARSEYETNPEYPEGKKYHTRKGDLVRSKSEVFIADSLFIHKIPYHYEEKLDLGIYGIFYPDFIICHPKYMRNVYWEHFGLMDNEDYIHKAYRKLDIYTQNGIIPTINLITTFETRDNPIDPYRIEKIIREQFL